MAVPSSPPRLPESELHWRSSPPPLPAAPPASCTAFCAGRKRCFTDSAHQSSDPLFSDSTTDSDQSLLEYDQPQRKRFVRGPWWGLSQHRSPDNLRKRLVRGVRPRNVDSGVWMGSDETENSLEGDDSLPRMIPSLEVTDDHSGRITIEPQNEVAAAECVQACLDSGQERIDLSGLALDDLSGATLRNLHQLIRPAHLDLTRPPSEDAFSPLTPSIQLFLARNSLTRLPPELFDLVNISVLSVRNNKLSELDPAISRLCNLKEFNIAGNQLRYLPWTLIHLMSPASARQITIRPNPLLSPIVSDSSSPAKEPGVDFAAFQVELAASHDAVDTYNSMRERCLGAGVPDEPSEMQLRLMLGREQRRRCNTSEAQEDGTCVTAPNEMTYLASSRIVFYRVDGTPLRDSASNPDCETSQWPINLAIPDLPADQTKSPSCPSLIELSLRSLQSVIDSRGIRAILPEELSPSLHRSVIRAVSDRSGHGLECCSSCGKPVVVPRARWVEYWFYGLPSQNVTDADAILPFMRISCSWACAIPSQPGRYIT